MNDIKARIFVYCIIGFCAGIYFFFTGFRKLWQKRLIQNIPTSKVRSLAMGLIELAGKAVPDVLLTAPYTKTPCVFYHIIIERLERRYSRHGSHTRWVKELEMKTDIPFFLEDDTGSVVIDPRKAETDLPLRYNQREGNKRYREYHIGQKEGIYVLGTAKKVDSLEEKTHKEVEKRIREIIENPEEKAKLDANKDMWIDENEWEAARKKVRREVEDEFSRAGEEFKKSSRSVPAHLQNVVVGMGELDKHFLLSTKSEKELITHYRMKSFLAIVGGALLTVICLKIILSYKF